jgi:hypothetical protein
MPGGHGGSLGKAVMTTRETPQPELTAGLIERFLDAAEPDAHPRQQPAIMDS